MSKNAKIGLAVVLVLGMAGGGIAWWLKAKSAAARAVAEMTEKAELEAEKVGTGDPKFHPHNGKELPKVLAAATVPGHPQQREGDRDLWKIPDYRRRQENSGEARAISPPPGATMSESAVRDNLDPNESYNLKRRGELPIPSGPPEPPAEAAAASASGGHQRDPFGNRSIEEYRSREKSSLDIDNKRPAVETPLERPGPNYRENARGGYVPHPGGPIASLSSNERHRLRGGGRFDRSNDLGENVNSGIRGDGTYDVQPNDDFWSISKKLYGTNGYFQALAELNRGKAPDGQLKVGQNILTPDADELEKKYPALCARENHREARQNQNRGNTLVSAHNLRGTRSYTVVEGDTLFDIARYELGKASRWAEIYELNRDALGKDFDYLVPGTELAMPEDNASRPDPVTRRPADEYRR